VAIFIFSHWGAKSLHVCVDLCLLRLGCHNIVVVLDFGLRLLVLVFLALTLALDLVVVLALSCSCVPFSRHIFLII